MIHFESERKAARSAAGWNRATGVSGWAVDASLPGRQCCALAGDLRRRGALPRGRPVRGAIHALRLAPVQCGRCLRRTSQLVCASAAEGSQIELDSRRARICPRRARDRRAKPRVGASPQLTSAPCAAAAETASAELGTRRDSSRRRRPATARRRSQAASRRTLWRAGGLRRTTRHSLLLSSALSFVDVLRALSFRWPVSRVSKITRAPPCDAIR